MRRTPPRAGLLALLATSLLVPAATAEASRAPEPDASTAAASVSATARVSPLRAASSTTTPAMRGYATSLLRELNKARAAHGLRRLTLDWRLVSAARRYTGEVATTGALSHTGRDGRGPNERIRAAGWRGPLVGETLAVGYGPAACVQAWLNSPGHRAILLEGRFQRVGLAAARGAFSGRP